MRCAHAEKLIPLFAGDDLPAPEAEVLRRHLESCAKCQRLATEFKESRDWLRGFAAPHYEEEALDGMRDSVLRDIVRIENRARLIQWIVPGRNFRFAFVTSLALLFGAVLSLTVNRRLSPHNPESNRVEISTGTAPDDRTYSYKQITIVKAHPKKFRRQLIKHEPDESAQIETEKVEPDLIAKNMNTAEPAIDRSADTDSAAIDPEANHDMLRIEIQTADPNIRIIWFAPKSDATPRK